MKTKMNVKTLLLGLLIGTAGIAQEEAPPVKTYHRLGLHAGGTTGTGFSYKLSHKDKYQVQIAAIPFASAGSQYINAGVTLFRKVVNTRGFDILGYVGGNYSYSSGAVRSVDGFVPPVIPLRDSGTRYNSSFGLAFEVGTSELFKFCFQGGYGIYAIGNPAWQTYASFGIGLEFGLNQILSSNDK